MLIDFIVISLGLAALVWSADQFVEGAAAIACRAGMAPLLVGMTIVSVGTSAPEILVSLMSALSGAGALAVGNAFGSNIANIGLVLGVTLLISPINVGRTTCFLDLPLLLITVLLCGYLLKDGVLGFSDACILLGALVLFLLRMARHATKPDINDEAPEIHVFPMGKAWLIFGIGLLGLIASSRALVYSAVNIASTFGISELVIGLTIVAVGTSLPEMAAAVASALKGHADIAIGTVVGSNMFNLLVVLALPGLFDELELAASDIARDLGTVMITTLSLSLFAWFGWKGTLNRARIGRRAGGTFLSIYVIYYAWLFIQPSGA